MEVIMKRIRIFVAYDGTNYCGWQVQPNGVTIEEKLNKSLARLTGEEIRIIGASRTDSGVHALGNVAVFDTTAALLAAFVIIPGMAVGGAELSSGGPGLMFIYLLNVFNGMPGGRVVEMVFYICVLFAGLSSLVNLYEAPVEMLEERFGMKRKMAVACMASIGGIAALLIQGIVSGWMDAVSIYICPLGAMLAGIMFFWVAGDDFALSAVNQGKERPIGRWFLPLGRFVLVPAAAIALIAGAILGGIG